MFKLKIKLLLIFLLLASSSGCAGVKLVENRKKFTSERTVSNHSYSVNIPIVRVAVVTPVDIAESCRSPNWKSVDVTPGLMGVVVPIFTLSTVDPVKTTIRCALGSHPNAAL